MIKSLLYTHSNKHLTSNKYIAENVKMLRLAESFNILGFCNFYFEMWPVFGEFKMFVLKKQKTRHLKFTETDSCLW